MDHRERDFTDWNTVHWGIQDRSEACISIVGDNLRDLGPDLEDLQLGLACLEQGHEDEVGDLVY